MGEGLFLRSSGKARAVHDVHARPHRVLEARALGWPVKLYLVDVVTKAKILEVLVHAEDAGTALAYVASKFPHCELQNCRELGDVPRHFVVAEGDRDA